LQVEPLTQSDISKMVEDILPVDGRDKFADVRIFDIQHAIDGRFRVAVMGDETSRSVILTRIVPQTPPLFTAGDWEKQPPIESTLSLEGILAKCVGKARRDAILVPGCSPLAWSQWDIQVIAAKPISGDEVASMIAQKMPPERDIRRDNGFLNFGMLFEKTKFNVAIFGGTSPTLTAIMNISADELRAV
jgi:Tfp pilus assembly pilus retraction ATPase PilT